MHFFKKSPIKQYFFSIFESSIYIIESPILSSNPVDFSPKPIWIFYHKMLKSNYKWQLLVNFSQNLKITEHE